MGRRSTALLPYPGSTLTTSRISVIVSTYERADALDAVLRGLSKQSEDDFEIVVADDGSGPETAEVVAAWQSRRSRVVHVWHPDDGFRLAEIRNRAVAESSGDYLVFLDGDCIPRPDFIAGHQRLAEPGWIVCGHRLMLPEALTREVIERATSIEEWTVSQWVREWRRGSIDRLTPFLRLPGTTWRRHLIRRRTNKVRGCNMALWRSDFLKVDGFDAELVGWGHEDNDLATRLRMVGVYMKDGRWATGVLHLWHEPADRSNEAKHWERIAASISTGRTMAVRGFSSIQEKPANACVAANDHHRTSGVYRPPRRDAVAVAGLFLTHTWSSRIKRHFNRLVRETDGQMKWHLHCSGSHAEPAAESALPLRFRQMLLKGGLQGGFLDAAIWPWLIALDADFIWIMEYDVDFSGDWAKLFGQFSNNPADLLATTIVPRRESADWFWWKSAEAPPHVRPQHMYRAFLPIMRVSDRFVREYARSVEDPRWSGHFEFTIPTVAISAGLEVEDIGGDGPLCPESRRNRNYRNAPGDWCLSPGTFVWRPSRRRYFVEAPETFPEANLLYHPVKAGVPEWRKEFAQDS